MLFHEAIAERIKDEFQTAPLPPHPSTLEWLVSGATKEDVRRLTKPQDTPADWSWWRRIGTSGWDWQAKQSLFWFFDWDSASNHADGLTDAQLDEVIRRLQSAPYATVFRSRGGYGIQAIIQAPRGTMAESEKHHAAICHDAVLPILCRDTGIDPTTLDKVGVIGWVVAVDAADEAYTVLQQATETITLCDIPAPPPPTVERVRDETITPEFRNLINRTRELGGAASRDQSGLYHIHLATFNQAAGEQGYGTIDLPTGTSDPASPNHWLDYFGDYVTVGPFKSDTKKERRTLWLTTATAEPDNPLIVDGITRAIDDPRVTAEEYARQNPTVCIDDDIFVFDGRRWNYRSPQQMIRALTRTHEQLIDRLHKEHPRGTPKKALKTHAVNALNTLGARREVNRPFGKLQFRLSDPSADVRHIHRFANGDLDVTKFINGDSDYLSPIDSDLFIPYAVDFDFDTSATCPGFDRFIASLELQDDERDYLQMVFGYCAYPVQDLQKFVTNTGPRRAGKGVLRDQLVALKGGPSSVASVTMEEFGSRFGLEKCINRSLIIGNEAVAPGKTMKPSVARLKEVTGGDAVSVDRKGKVAVDYLFGCPVWLLTNDRLALVDESGALSARQLVLPFRESFYGRENFNLKNQLAQERSGIAIWALDGLRKLKANGWQFNVPDSFQDVADELASLASPTRSFLDSRFVIDKQFCMTEAAIKEVHRIYDEETDPAKATLAKDLIACDARLTRKKMTANNADMVDRCKVIRAENESTRRPYVIKGLRPADYQLAT